MAEYVSMYPLNGPRLLWPVSKWRRRVLGAYFTAVQRSSRAIITRARRLVYAQSVWQDGFKEAKTSGTVRTR